MTRKLTLQEAYELSVKKWRIIVRDDGGAENVPKMYNKFTAGCPYCELFAERNALGEVCVGCPLDLGNRALDDLACCESGHPWNTWYEADVPTKEQAQAVLDLIIKTKPEGGIEP